MGLIIGDKYILENGVTMTNYYLYIDGVTILKTPVKNEYTVLCDARTYASREMRDAGKEAIEMRRYSISTSDLTNLHTQLYDRIKLNYENVSDVFEPIEN